MHGSPGMRSFHSAVTSEILLCLVHESPDGGFPAWLNAGIIGRIQVGGTQFAHQGLYHCRGGCARHAGEGVHIHHAVVSRANARKDRGNAETGLRCHIKGEEVIIFKGLFEMRNHVITDEDRKSVV